MNIPPCRGCSRPRQIPTDEEAAFTPQAPHSQKGPQVPLEFEVPPMPQPDFFPPLTTKACQAYANFWYAQAQAGQGQYPVPLTTTFA